MLPERAQRPVRPRWRSRTGDRRNLQLVRRGQCVANRDSLVQHPDTGPLEIGHVFGRVGPGGLHDGDATVDDRRPVLGVRDGRDGWGRIVSSPRASGRSLIGDHLCRRQGLRAWLGQGGEEVVGADVGNGCNVVRCTNRRHATAHDGCSTPGDAVKRLLIISSSSSAHEGWLLLHLETSNSPAVVGIGSFNDPEDPSQA